MKNEVMGLSWREWKIKGEVWECVCDLIDGLMERARYREGKLKQ